MDQDAFTYWSPISNLNCNILNQLKISLSTYYS